MPDVEEAFGVPEDETDDAVSQKSYLTVQSRC